MARYHSKEERALLPESERIAEEMAIKENLGKTMWVKGQSGNPSGRPKTPEDAKKALKDTAFDAVLQMIEIANNPDDKNRFEALKYILDRVYGKATQPIDVAENKELTVRFGDYVGDCSEWGK